MCLLSDMLTECLWLCNVDYDFHVIASWFVFENCPRDSEFRFTPSHCKMLSARPVGLPLDADRGFSTKTPGRGLTKTRNVLQENTIRNAPMSVIGKGRKMVQNTPLQSKTLRKCILIPLPSCLTSTNRSRSRVERPSWQAGRSF